MKTNEDIMWTIEVIEKNQQGNRFLETTEKLIFCPTEFFVLTYYTR